MKYIGKFWLSLPVFITAIAGLIAAIGEVYNNGNFKDTQALSKPTPTSTPTATSTPIATLKPTPKPIFTPIPTSTPIPTPTPTPTLIPKPNVKNTPDKAILEYYQLINQREYEKTWNTLTPTFQRNKSKNDYNYYKNFWNTVESANITSIKIIKQTKNKAIVDANIVYTMKDENEDIWTDPSGIITLILDVNGNWLINDKSG